MTEARMAAPAGVARDGGMLGFLREALASLRNRRLLVPVLLLAVLLTGTNIVLALSVPPLGADPSPAFIAAAVARLLGLFVLAVAILRLINGSPRNPWMPDEGFWAYALTIVFGLLVTMAAARLFGSRAEGLPGLLTGIVVMLAGAPVAAWFVALAVERPPAWRPGPWVGSFGRWLPHLVLWSAVLILPLGQLHAAGSALLVHGAGRWFWPLALVDGPLSVVLALLGLALASTAYRRVARG